MSRLLVLASVVILAACSSAGREVRTGARGDSKRITADELASATHTNLYSYIQAYHPRWFENQRPTSFSGRSSGLVVYLDNQRFGTADQLKSMTLSGVKEIRFYTVSEAQQRFSVKDLEAVIHVVTK